MTRAITEVEPAALLAPSYAHCRRCAVVRSPAWTDRRRSFHCSNRHETTSRDVRDVLFLPPRNELQVRHQCFALFSCEPDRQLQMLLGVFNKRKTRMRLFCRTPPRVTRRRAGGMK